MSRKLLVIGYVWPEPQTTAAGQRMLQLLNAFKDFGFDITFASTATPTMYSLDLESLQVKPVPIQLNHPSFDSFVQELDPLVVVFDRFMVEEQFGWRVAEQVPGAIRILNTEDLHSLRKVREIGHKKGEEFSLAAWKAAEMTKREVASIYRSDLSLLVSTYEMELLVETLKLPDQILMHLPFMLEEPTTTAVNELLPFEERNDFITYGNGKHAPNVDSLMYLRETLWPLIREQLPDAQLKIYGGYLPQQVMEMHQPTLGIHVMGWAANLDLEINRARVCLAPLRFGAGIKGKLVQAMQNGTPSVTTSIGAEGISHEGDWPGEICDDPVEFAKAAVRLYQNKKAWQAASQKGVDLIRLNFLKAYWHKQLTSKLEELSVNLSAHRSENFIGSLLQHHTIASTKYLGKWIEEKNRG